MLFSALFQWIYCLSFSQILIAAVFLCLLFFRIRGFLASRPLWRVFCGVLLLFWALTVLWSTLLGRSSVSGQFSVEPLFQSYRKLFLGDNPEILRSNFMNLLLFFPAGLLLFQLIPGSWPRWLALTAAAVILIAFSAGIEIAQFRGNLGCAEADDVLHNGLGALLGALLSLLVPLFENPEQ